MEKIRQIHDDNRKVYGARRIHAELLMDHDIKVGRKRVERLMRQGGLSGLVPKQHGKTTVRYPASASPMTLSSASSGRRPRMCSG